MRRDKRAVVPTDVTKCGGLTLIEEIIKVRVVGPGQSINPSSNRVQISTTSLCLPSSTHIRLLCLVRTVAPPVLNRWKKASGTPLDLTQVLNASGCRMVPGRLSLASFGRGWYVLLGCTVHVTPSLGYVGKKMLGLNLESPAEVVSLRQEALRNLRPRGLRRQRTLREHALL